MVPIGLQCDTQDYSLPRKQHSNVRRLVSGSSEANWDSISRSIVDKIGIAMVLYLFLLFNLPRFPFSPIECVTASGFDCCSLRMRPRNIKAHIKSSSRE